MPISAIYKMTNAFVIESKFQRAPEIPNPLNLNLSVQMKLADVTPRSFSVFLLVKTESESPLDFSVEAIGQFELVPEQARPRDPSAIIDFVNERAIFMLWPYVKLTVLQATGGMGMVPFSIFTPHNFSFDPQPPLPPFEDSLPEVSDEPTVSSVE